MKKELSALEIGYVVKEFNELISSKVDEIFQPDSNEILICLFIPNKGKKVLRILPNFIYLTDDKRASENPTGFCMTLRKYLSGSRLRRAAQLGSERIIEFLFETKDSKYLLIVEVFGKGNVVLCKEDYEIIALLGTHKWKDRELVKAAKYKMPPGKISFFDIDEKKLKKALENDKVLVKKLAIDLGLGGVYSEEACLLGNLDKNKTELNDEDLDIIIKTVKKIITKKTDASVVYENGGVLDIIPFKLEIYKNLETKNFGSYNSALDSVMSENLKLMIENEKTKGYESKIKKLEDVIEKQKEKLEEIEESIAENEKKAEAIYSNYNISKEILETIKKASQKYSWNEIKEKLKNHETIKEFNAKDKKIILELK